MKLKTLALAALAVAAAPSFAAIKFDGTLGQGEYVFLATNSAGSYALDLGVSTDFIAAMTAGTSFTQAVGGAEWNKFLAFGGANTQWSIIAVQPLDVGFFPGEINSWSTVNVNQALGSVWNTSSNDGASALGTHYADINTKTSGANGSLASVVNSVTYTNRELVTFNNQFNTANAIGTSATMVYLTASSEESTAPSLYNVLTTTASFDGTNITIAAAPVPEPSTYAMLVAGLAAVGFVARRRKSA